MGICSEQTALASPKMETRTISWKRDPLSRSWSSAGSKGECSFESQRLGEASGRQPVCTKKQMQAPLPAPGSSQPSGRVVQRFLPCFSESVLGKASLWFGDIYKSGSKSTW